MVFRQLDGEQTAWNSFQICQPALIASSVAPTDMESAAAARHSQYCDVLEAAAEHPRYLLGLEGKFRTVRSHMDVGGGEILLAALGEKRHTLREPITLCHSASRCCQRS